MARLREFRIGDSEKYFKWINERDLVLFNSTYAPISEIEHNEWVKSISSKNDNRTFSIVVDDDGNEILIGSCSLRNIDLLNATAELQIRIGESSHWGKGHGTDAIKSLIKFGFNDLNLSRIYLDVFEHNARAIATYENCGFVREGVKRDAVFIDGRRVNVVLMAILRVDFLRRI